MDSEPKVFRGTAALQRGRWSSPAATYFITGNLDRQLTGLTTPPLAQTICEHFHVLNAAGHWHIRTYVLMPDHFHAIVTLGPKTDLSSAVRLFKGPLAPVLRGSSLRWQKNFYDHRLRATEELLPTFLYIFLNPYRTKLIAVHEKWPCYYCAPEDWEWFGGLTNSSVPFPEWLR